MKNLLLITLLMFYTLTHAQFSEHNLELGLGGNLHSGALSGSQEGLHANLTYRYNLTPKFGIGLRTSYDSLENDNFTTESINFTPEMFFRLLKFNNFAIISHLGAGYSYLNDDNALNYIIGGELLHKTTEKVNLKLGYMVTSYSFQKYNLDNVTPITSNGINSYTNQVYVGVNVNLGKKVHADWYTRKYAPKVIYKTKRNLINVTNIVKSDYLVPIVNDVFFKENSYKIDKSEIAAIETVFDIMQENSELKLLLVGTACSGSGSDNYNKDLSEKRAKAVKDKLISMGINEDRLEYIGLGKDTKFTSKDSDAQKRVSFTFKK